MDTPDGSKWAARNPEKAAEVRRTKERVSKHNNKKKGKTYQERSESEKEFDDDQSGAWILEENVLIRTDAINMCDVVLDTGATNHIF